MHAIFNTYLAIKALATPPVRHSTPMLLTHQYRNDMCV
jgi:hypothetical protein